MADEAYERGRVDQTLTDHGIHLAKINGSIDRFADEVHDLTLVIQRLADAAAADRDTALATARALKDAEESRWEKSRHGWTPVQRLMAFVTALSAVVGTVYLLVYHTRGH